MHNLSNLLSYMLPIQIMIFEPQQEIPPGFDYVITNTGAFVVTVRNNFVIAPN